MTTRTFTLERSEDITGVSGTGVVADGATFPDGTTVVRWRDLGGPAADRGVRPTTVVFPSVEAVEALHGHNGATRVVWADEVLRRCEGCRRSATHEDAEGVPLCGPCWTSLDDEGDGR